MRVQTTSEDDTSHVAFRTRLHGMFKVVCTVAGPTRGSLSGQDFAGITVVMAHNPARMNPTTTSTTIQPKVRQKLLPLPSVTLPQFKYFSDAALCLSVERVLSILEDYCCAATTRPPGNSIYCRPGGEG